MYIIFILLCSSFDLLQVDLFKIAKHWDSFLSHCRSKVTIQEITTDLTDIPKQKGKSKAKASEEPPAYESLLKQINTCSMEDRQKILEVFSNDGGSDRKDF